MQIQTHTDMQCFIKNILFPHEYRTIAKHNLLRNPGVGALLISKRMLYSRLILHTAQFLDDRSNYAISAIDQFHCESFVVTYVTIIKFYFKWEV